MQNEPLERAGRVDPLEAAVIAASERQVDEIIHLAAGSGAFSEQEAIELIRWFNWRTERLLDQDLKALDGLRKHEEKPGEPFVARWNDIADAGGASPMKLGTAFHRLEHAGVAERLGRDRKNRTLWRLIREAA